MRVPVLVGPVRGMKDGEGRDATAVDVLFHPAVVQRALQGGKTVTKEHYRDYLIQIATKNIHEDHGIDLARARTEVLPTARYKGPKGKIRRTHTRSRCLPPMRGAGEEPSATATREPGNPIIQETGTARRRPE